MNKVVLIGRLTKDIELKYTQSGTAVASVNLAVDRRFSKEKEADFIPIVIWDKAAENLAQYLGKGSQVGISGRIQTRSYEAEDGSRRYVTEVVAEEVQFLDKKGEGRNQGHEQGQKNSFEDMEPIDDGDIPF